MKTSRKIPLIEIFPPQPGQFQTTLSVDEIAQAALPTFDLYGTHMLEAISYTSLQGAVDSLNLESAVYPNTNEIWKVLAFQGWSDDAGPRAVKVGYKMLNYSYEVAINSGWISPAYAAGVLPYLHAPQFYIPPRHTLKMWADSLGAGKRLEFKCWYVKLPLGETFPS